MSEKHYGLECQKLIEAGKEIKIEKENSRHYHYCSTWSRGNYITYYLCPPGFKKQQAEMQAKREKDWIYFAGLGRGIILVLILIMVWFML